MAVSSPQEYFHELPDAKRYYITPARQNEELASYLIENLQQLMSLQPIDLHHWFSIPPGYYPQGPDYLIELIGNDIGMMLGDGSVTAFHLLFCKEQPNNAGHYNVNYHAQYDTNPVPPSGRTWTSISPGRGDSLQVEEAHNARIVLLVDWQKGLPVSAFAGFQPPEYFFKWHHINASYSRYPNMVRYQDGLANAFQGEITS